MVKNLPAMWGTRVWFLGQEDPLEESMATHSSVLPWRIPWTEEPGGLQCIGLHRVEHDWCDLACTHTYSGNIFGYFWSSKDRYPPKHLKVFIVLGTEVSCHLIPWIDQYHSKALTFNEQLLCSSHDPNHFMYIFWLNAHATGYPISYCLGSWIYCGI